MLYGYGVLLLVQLVVLVYCALDVVRTPADQVKHLPKALWLVLVVLFPLVGGGAWLFAGRPKGPVVARPQRAPLPPPDDDEDFLRELRRRAEEQRRRARDEDDPPAPA